MLYLISIAFLNIPVRKYKIKMAITIITQTIKFLEM